MIRTTALRLWPLVICTSLACTTGEPEGSPVDAPDAPDAVEATAATEDSVMLCAEDAPTVPRVALSWDDAGRGALVVTNLIDEPILAHLEITTFGGSADGRVSLGPVRLDARAAVRVDVAGKLAAQPTARLRLRARADVFSEADGATRLGRTLSERAELHAGRITELDPSAEAPVLDPGGRLDDDDRVALRRVLRTPGVTSEAIMIGAEVTLDEVRATRHVALEGGAR